MWLNCKATGPVGALFSAIAYSPFAFVLVNASVFVPLTTFTITSLTGLFCRSITRPVTRTCADAWMASAIYNTMYKSRFISSLILIQGVDTHGFSVR